MEPTMLGAAVGCLTTANATPSKNTTPADGTDDARRHRQEVSFYWCASSLLGSTWRLFAGPVDDRLRHREDEAVEARPRALAEGLALGEVLVEWS
ncbi:hypothetical protein GUJ93_ZPchr0002g26676 [Zizania palustris]|uniref:Uncharacterized protein n=1 Tax=Zizania palustris TaxID=103762 RepID=A0A8J5RTB9_ZIZPA|nr:hypothetical protein GUJ93_ZPchr0002g26676 [Zizania palustris]